MNLNNHEIVSIKELNEVLGFIKKHSNANSSIDINFKNPVLSAKNGHCTPPAPEKSEHSKTTNKVLTHKLLPQNVVWFIFAVFRGSHNPSLPISLKEHEIAKLQDYKSSLINSLVTGKVKVC
ncbi:MAG: hypothetical protein NXH86_09220 [Flavobacteriaceae bacterium]|nr:hypothetical protein [Flavobacteriaceae bacterium]